MEAGNKKMQYVAACTAYLTCFSAGITWAWTSPVMVRMDNMDYSPLDHNLTTTQQMQMGSLLSLGTILGPFPNAYLADNYGRKWTLLGSTVPFLLGWILIGTTKTIEQILVARVILGIACSYVLSILPTYIAEISEEVNRAGIGCIGPIFVTSGMLFSYAVGPYLGFVPFVITCAIPPAIFAITFLFMPESPYFLMAKDRYEDSVKSLTILRGKSRINIQNDAKLIQNEVREEMRNPGSYKELLTTRSNLKALLITTGLACFQQLEGVSVIVYYSEYIFKMTSSDFPSELSSIIMGIVQLLACLVPPLIADKFGRKNILIWSAIGRAISMFCLGLYFFFSEKNYTDIVSALNWFPVVCIVVFTVAMSSGAIIGTISAEIYPTNLRNRASVIDTLAASAMGFLVTRFFGDMETVVNTSGTFWIYSSFCIISIVFVYFLLPETRGLTFQEIQDIMTKRKRQEIELLKE